MRLHLEQIPDEGQCVEFDQSDSWALAAATRALEGPPQALSGTLSVRRFATDLAVSGNIRAVVSRGCDRCGEGVRLTVEGPVALTYSAPLEDDGVAAPIQLSPGDLDLGFYDGETLDLGNAIEEQLVLLLPSKLACDVAGIEPEEKCGEGTLRASENEPEVDPRFAMLANLKIKG